MPKHFSQYLIDEPALQALPSLACLVGLTGAVILQQIHWWTRISEHKIEGYIWVYNSYDAWAKQFKWLTPRALQKQILQLEKGGYLISKTFAYKGKGRTKWYRVDYDSLTKQRENNHNDGEKSNNQCEESNNDGENIHNDSALSSHHLSLSQASKNTRRIPEEYQKNTKEEVSSSLKTPAPKLHKREIFAKMQQVLGYPEKTDKDPIPNYGKEAKAIKRMTDRGYTEPDIFVAWVKKVSDRGEFVSMVYVNEDIGKLERTKNAQGRLIALDPDRFIKGKFGGAVNR